MRAPTAGSDNACVANCERNDNIATRPQCFARERPMALTRKRDTDDMPLMTRYARQNILKALDRMGHFLASRKAA